MEMEDTNLEAVRAILLAESSPSLLRCWSRKWLDKGSVHVNLHSGVQVKGFSSD